MKDILINYPIKFLQKELINLRTGYRLEKKRISEILKTMKSIKKLTKDELIELLIRHNYDISKLPKIEELKKEQRIRKPKYSTGKSQVITREELERRKTAREPKNYKDEKWYLWQTRHFKDSIEEQNKQHYKRLTRGQPQQRKDNIKKQLEEQGEQALKGAIDRFNEELKDRNKVEYYKEMYKLNNQLDEPDKFELYQIEKKDAEAIKLKTILTTEKNLDKIEKIEPILLSTKDIKLSTDEYIKFRDNLNKENYEETIKEMFKRKLTLENILSIADIRDIDIKTYNAFFTPKKETDKLIDMSEIRYDNNKEIKILETSAGIGNLIIRLFNRDFDNKYNYKVDCYEILKLFYTIGKVIFENIKSVKWYNDDFLKQDIQKKYNYVFTNPPFNIKSAGKTYYDVDFLNKSYSLLEDGGKLCAIISIGYKTGRAENQKKFLNSIQKLKEMNDNYVKIEEIQGFKNTDEGTTKLMKTNVNMEMMIITKIANMNLI